MKASEDFKKERYTIPQLTVGGSTRPDAFASTGDTFYVVAGATGVVCTVTGTRVGSTAFFQEEFNTTASSSAGGIASAYTDWTNVFGVTLTNKNGMNMSTQSIDLSVYQISTNAGSTGQVAYISSGNKSTKACIFNLNGHNVTIHNQTGNIFVNTVNYPTSNNSWELTADMITDERVRQGYLMLEGTTGTNNCQIRVWED